MNTEILIESILFWRNEPVTISRLAAMIKADNAEVESALVKLGESLRGRGIVLTRKDNEVMLGTSPEASAIIEGLTKEELSKELSKAALETLSIVLYKAPVRRSEIDYIRGVNSQFIMRHLETRGLIEKIESPDDARVYLYRPTFDLLNFIGIKSIEELPEFNSFREKIEEFETTKAPEQPQEENTEDEVPEMAGEEPQEIAK